MDITSENLSAAVLDQVIADENRGKRYAFTPVSREEGKPWGVGVAVADEPGYRPILMDEFTWDDYGEATTFCDRMNEHIGLSERDAGEIVTSSMRAYRH